MAPGEQGFGAARSAIAPYQRVRLTQKQALRRKELAREILMAALRHCEELGVTVGVQGAHGTKALRAVRVIYHHEDAN